MSLSKAGVVPLPARMDAADVSMVSVMASIGLTVALFIAGEAFKQERLQAEAKMGALFSGLMGAVCAAFSRTRLWKHSRVAKGPPLPPPGDVMLGRESCMSQVEAVRRLSRATLSHETALKEGEWDEDDEIDDVDNVAFIVAASLARSMLETRQAALMRERKAILNGHSASDRRTNVPFSPSSHDRYTIGHFGSPTSMTRQDSSARSPSRRARAAAKSSGG